MSLSVVALALVGALASAGPVTPVLRIAASGGGTHMEPQWLMPDGAPTEDWPIGGVIDVTVGARLGSFALTLRESVGDALLIYEYLEHEGRAHSSDALASVTWTASPIETVDLNVEAGLLLPISVVTRAVGSPGGLASQARLSWRPAFMTLWTSVDVADHPLGSDGPMRGGGFMSTSPARPVPPSPGLGAMLGLSCDPQASDALFRLACVPDPRQRMGVAVGAAADAMEGRVRAEVATTATVATHDWITSVAAAFVRADVWLFDAWLTTRVAVRVRPLPEPQLLELSAGVFATPLHVYNGAVLPFASVAIGL